MDLSSTLLAYHRRAALQRRLSHSSVLWGAGKSEPMIEPPPLADRTTSPLIHGIAFYGGDWTRGVIRNTRSGNGKIRPWTNFPAPNGTYTVHQDCTGAFFDPNGTRANNLVVLDGGKRFFLLSVLPDTITTEEG